MDGALESKGSDIAVCVTILRLAGIQNELLEAFNHILRPLDEKTACILVKSVKTLSPGRCVEYYLDLPNTTNLQDLRRDFKVLGRQFTAEVAVQLDTYSRKHKRLTVFDMDSTLIQQEVIDEIARHAGVVDKVSEITELAMQGKLDFAASLQRRVALLENLPIEVLDQVRARITFSPGARDLCRALKRLDMKLAVASGGFIPLARYVQQELGLDYAYANTLGTNSDGTRLNGLVEGTIVTGNRKAELLQEIAQEEGFRAEQTMAVGDGANDLPMCRIAGLSVAYHAKPALQEEAIVCINENSLLNTLYFLGYTDAEQAELLS